MSRGVSDFLISCTCVNSSSLQTGGSPAGKLTVTYDDGWLMMNRKVNTLDGLHLGVNGFSLII